MLRKHSLKSRKYSQGSWQPFLKVIPKRLLNLLTVPDIAKVECEQELISVNRQIPKHNFLTIGVDFIAQLQKLDEHRFSFHINLDRNGIMFKIF